MTDPAAALTVTVDGDPGARDLAALTSALRAFNRAAIGTGMAPTAPLAVWLRDPAGGLCGGLSASIYYRWAYIELLWIAAEARGHGHGTRLMAAAENAARGLGLIGLMVDTFSFQAPDFYRKLGYVTVGEIADFPPPHTRFYLQKRL